MEIALNFFGEHHAPLKAIAQQLGVKKAVCTVPFAAKQSSYIDSWHSLALRSQQAEMASFGMEIGVLEGIKFIDAAKLGTADCDKAIDDFKVLLKNMSAVGIDTVCYNWMPVFGWFRTHMEVPVRGGASATAFRQDSLGELEDTKAGKVSGEKLWGTLEYFLSQVVPVAERYRIKLALHPDDPPVPSIAGVDRILISSDAMMRAIELVPSEYNGIAFCQGTFATMGCDVAKEIRRFGPRIHFAHFRDVAGTRDNFVETFADDGVSDMEEAVSSYYDIGFSGVIRPDHTPTFIGEDNRVPGYGILGNLYTVGYLRGLMEAVEKGRRGERDHP